MYYFNNKKQGELDFVIEDGGSVLPIEIKSGKDYKRHNALLNIMGNEEYGIKRAIVFSNANLSVEGEIEYYPIYMLMHLRQKQMDDTVVRFKPL